MIGGWGRAGGEEEGMMGSCMGSTLLAPGYLFSFSAVLWQGEQVQLVRYLWRGRDVGVGCVAWQ